MMEIEDWEKRSENTPLKVHMIAGCLAGLIEHVSMLPLDNVKTHLQVLPNSKFSQTFLSLKKQGLKTFFNGYGAVTAGCMPAHAFYFSSYEILKTLMDVNDENIHAQAFAFIGAVSTLWHDLIMVPFDVIKQRQQIQEKCFKRTVKTVLRQEGLIAFYRSFPITYLMSAPYQAIFFSANETIKTLMFKKSEHNFLSHFSCAAMAGCAAVFVMNPLDVVKTKLQTQSWHLNSSQVKYSTFLGSIKTIFKEEGYLGFYKGLLPRLCMQTMSGATAWASYEFIKRKLLPISDIN
ncbi:unnamed protein product [Paramecium primaurelia]|uniref:Mitochondrial carrier protein n=1 Tax=Paramecium primaurelia TaxID=5886 RepID=A0A8S1KPD8_PARPR|nr:unnamed protein product [Paramecium primaurelia]